MSLAHIAVFVLAALLYNWIAPARWRGWLLMIASVLAIYWLQPQTPTRQLDFFFPTATLVIAFMSWLFTRQERSLAREDWAALGVMCGLVLLISSTRYLVPELRLTSRPPDILAVSIALTLIIGLNLALWRLLRSRPLLLSFSILVIVALFVILKFEPLAVWFSGILRAWQGQDVSLATSADLNWLGFSYIAFRLIHTLRDRQTGQLPDLTLREYLTYIIFFPTYTAGPIDRAERFAPDYRDLPVLTASQAVVGLGRILIGLLKKFVIADSLALISLDATSAAQAVSAGGLWVLLYAYTFRLFFDFSGYTDIAIGIGILYGITLPENFNRPYLKSSITAFWQSWHMTLSNWVRFYIFSPLSRWLLGQSKRPPLILVLLICHLATMIVIGLWHGITWTFLIWGLWHGLGLFIHKLWSDRTRRWYRGLQQRPKLWKGWTVAGVVLTFHFVVLGWVWFALPDAGLALAVLGGLFGL